MAVPTWLERYFRVAHISAGRGIDIWADVGRDRVVDKINSLVVSTIEFAEFLLVGTLCCTIFTGIFSSIFAIVAVDDSLDSKREKTVAVFGLHGVVFTRKSPKGPLLVLIQVFGKLGQLCRSWLKNRGVFFERESEL